MRGKVPISRLFLYNDKISVSQELGLQYNYVYYNIL